VTEISLRVENVWQMFFFKAFKNFSDSKVIVCQNNKKLLLLQTEIIRAGRKAISLRENHLPERTLKLYSMYAIVTIGGHQFKVEKDRKIFVNRLNAEEGTSVDFDQVLMIDNDGDVKIGAPLLEGAKVTAKVLSHLKGNKVIVFKKKRRKGYRKKNGHRQYLSQIQIENIEG
jgi:large subunit ribosomal protein L21